MLDLMSYLITKSPIIILDKPLSKILRSQVVLAFWGEKDGREHGTFFYASCMMHGQIYIHS